MNLWIRLLWALWRSARLPKIRPGEAIGRTGFARGLLAAGWRPMSGEAFIRYRLRFALAGADAAWYDMRFEFLREDGMLRATGYTKGAAVGRGGLVPDEHAYARCGLPFAPTELPAAVQQWRAAEANAMGVA